MIDCTAVSGPRLNQPLRDFGRPHGFSLVCLLEPVFCKTNMRLLRTVRQCRPYAVARSHQAVFRRQSSTATGLLPLEGYRVLDMTRVLAGVSCCLPYV